MAFTDESIMDVFTAEDEAEVPTAPSISAFGPAGTCNVRKYDGKNFSVWKEQMKGYLTLRGVVDVLKATRPPFPRPDTKMTDKDRAERIRLCQEWDSKDMIARATIMMALDDNQALLVLGEKRARDVWMRLMAAHQQSSNVSRIVLQKQFHEAKMGANERVVNYVTRIQKIANEMADADITIAENSLVTKIVCGLNSKYNSFISSWISTASQRAYDSITETLPALIAHEEMLNMLAKKDEKKDGKTDTALVAQVKQKAKKKAVQDTSKATNSDQAKKNKNTPKETRSCFNCGLRGHLAAQCNKPKADDAKVAEVPLEGIVAECCNAASIKDTEWLVDSGASRHMTYDASAMLKYKTLSPPEKVRFGNNNYGYSVGMGEIHITSRTPAGERDLVLTGVLHVPELGRKLISIGAAAERGFTGEIRRDSLVLRNPQGKIRLVATKNGNLYRAEVIEIVHVNNSSDDEVLNVDDDEDDIQDVTQDTDDSLVWHQRLAHVSFRTLQSMQKNEAVVGLRTRDARKLGVRDEIMCDACVKAKHAKTPFRLSTRQRATQPGLVLHADLCGPVGNSISGCCYLAVFKDEATDYRIVYPIKKKGEFYESLVKCIAEIKTAVGTDVSCVVSDNASELLSGRAREMMLAKGITQRLSAPFCPQQNGYIEREMRTIMEAVRAMLFAKSLPGWLWAEAANAAVYVLNRTTNSIDAQATPFERFYGRKPRVAHLRVFGSLAYVKAQTKKRSGYIKKLASRSEAMLFVGYERDYTYRLMNPETRKITISRDVVFDERRPHPLFTKHVEDDSYQALDKLLEVEDNRGETDDEAHIANAVADDDVPQTYQQAMSSRSKAQWSKAMVDEMESMRKNNVWRHEQPPTGQHVIKSKWVFAKKKTLDGKEDKFKARLVAMGFSQRPGVDYNNTFSPVVRLDTVRVILTLVAKLNMACVHFDVKTAFLHAPLNETIYMKEPVGFETGVPCRLLKSIYGLKQASREWYLHLSGFLKRFNLVPLSSDPCVLMSNGVDKLIVAIYVDDGLVCSSNPDLLSQVICYLESNFEITKCDPKRFVGLEIERHKDKNTMIVHQATYTDKILHRFGMNLSREASTPMEHNAKFELDGMGGVSSPCSTHSPYREAIGSLMYLACGTRPDIAFAVSCLARFSHSPKICHWEGVKRILRYLNGTKHHGILLGDVDAAPLVIYTDADFAACVDTRQSVSGVLVLAHGSPVAWRSVKQSVVAESTTEAELIACNLGSRETLWMRQLAGELGETIDGPTPIMVDNQSSIKLIANDQVHSKIKHLDIKVMAVRDRVRQGQVKLEYVETKNQRADILTKALNRDAYRTMRGIIGVHSLMVGLLCICLVAPPSEGFKIRTTLLSRGTKTGPYFSYIKMTSPCEDVNKAYERVKETKGELSASAWVNVTLPALTKKMCEQAFNEKLVPAFHELAKCQQPRPKRNIIAAVGTAMNVAYGVTNLLRGLTETGPSRARLDNYKALMEQVNIATESDLTSAEKLSGDIRRELEMVSPSATHHQEFINQQSTAIPNMIWLTTHIMSEMYAGVANLQEIQKECQQGKLATYEVAEMVEDQRMQQLQPEDTEIDFVRVNKRELEAEFAYYTYEPFCITEVEMLYAGIAIISIIVLWVILRTYLMLNRHLSSPVDTRRELALVMQRKITYDL